MHNVLTFCTKSVIIMKRMVNAMATAPTQIESLSLFKELISCSGAVPLWHFDAQGRCLETNCMQQDVFETALNTFGVINRIIANPDCCMSPLLVGDAFGLIWGTEKSSPSGEFYVIGPVSFDKLTPAQAEYGFHQCQQLNLSIAFKRHFADSLSNVTQISFLRFADYMLMLHFCLCGEHIDVNHLVMDATPPANNVSTFAASNPDWPAHNRHKVYAAERIMLNMVREGNLNYKPALKHIMTLSNGVPVSGDDPLRQDKTSVIVFCSLVCRAAIEGGLSPEIAYGLGDSYIRMTEQNNAADELIHIALKMYDDFVNRVHAIQDTRPISPPIERSIEFIYSHLNEKLKADTLGALVGYNGYYLSRKFKEETGQSLNDFILHARIEQAKVLLATTDMEIPEIACCVGFATRSYFGQAFKQETGTTPAQYRDTV